MAFPASPNNGDIHGEYYYDEAKVAWKKAGAIKESGTNYTLFSDGTLICYLRRTLMSGSAAAASRTYTWTFPKPFVSGQVGVGWYFMENTSGIGYQNASSSNLNNGLKITLSGYSNAAGASYCTATAIGRAA